MKKRYIYRIKPSKGLSAVGLVFGLCFCALGVFVIIPRAGAFGIIWTLLAVVITVVNAINTFTSNGITIHEIIVDENEKNESENKSIDDRLTQLQRLYEKGIITTGEYEEKRKQFINKI